ncbi:MAG: DNA/RNA non-specific endonuclease [Blastocatellia bacterium]|nr:DNA/RNA non-specific endonuclease [Blastocatellia bacterium]
MARKHKAGNSKWYVVAIALISLAVSLSRCSQFKKGNSGEESTTGTKPPKSAPPSKSGDRQNMLLGNPSQAGTSPANYLIQRKEFAMAYNRDKGIPNWVCWHLEESDLGDVKRSQFRPDENLPDGFYRVTPKDYTNSGYDRGHMCPSADRDKTVAENEAVFVMSNIIPQAGGNNQGPWAKLEGYCRKLAEEGNEMYIISGGAGSKGKIADGKVAVPAKTWKVIVVLKKGQNDLDRINSSTRVIAVLMPNEEGIRDDDWQSFRTTVRKIEGETGYDLLSALPKGIQDALETKTDRE